MFTASKHHGTECPCKKLPLCLSSFTAAEFGDIHSLSLRLADRGSVEDSAGNSPLHLAAQHGHTAAVAFLLRLYDVNTASGGATALHRASFSGATNTMKLLLEERNCNLLARDASFGDEATPLHKACAGGRYLAVQLLLETLARRGELDVALSVTNAAGETPLDVVHLKLRHKEEEACSVARWNSVSSHLPDWERCESILQRFGAAEGKPDYRLMDDRVPDSLRKGSLCQPGDECVDGQCRTIAWERSFQAALMGRVDASIGATVTRLHRQQSNDEPFLVDDGTRKPDENDSSACERDVAANREEVNSATSLCGRSCGKCQQKSIVLYRRRGLLLCQECSG